MAKFVLDVGQELLVAELLSRLLHRFQHLEFAPFVGVGAVTLDGQIHSLIRRCASNLVGSILELRERLSSPC